jgi:hypothetical protein
VTIDSNTVVSGQSLNGSGQFTFTSSSLAAGRHDVEATYSGDKEYAPNTSGLYRQWVHP